MIGIKYFIALIAIISLVTAYPYHGEDRCGGRFGKCSPGECCSKYGYCGKSSSHCSISKGCQTKYGLCAQTSSSNKNKDRCGKKYGKCEPGKCCNKHGYCGTKKDYCEISKGCQSEFGTCKKVVNIKITYKKVDHEKETEPSGKIHWVGYRYSPDGLKHNYGKKAPSPSTFMKYTENFKDNFSGNPKGAYLLIVGTSSKSDYKTIHFKFPKPSGVHVSSSHIKYEDEDSYEEFLDECDKKGFDVWIQVEPGHNDLIDLAKIVFKRYGHHKSVKGYGIDLEWYYRKSSSGKGTKLDDKTAKKVVEEVRKFNSSYSVFAKHWNPSYMPDTYRKGMIFVDDSNDVSSVEKLKKDFREWAQKFSDTPVMFQIGYNEDHSLWKKDPLKFAKELANEAARYNDKIGIFWVDFSIKEFVEKAHL